MTLPRATIVSGVTRSGTRAASSIPPRRRVRGRVPRAESGGVAGDGDGAEVDGPAVGAVPAEPEPLAVPAFTAVVDPRRAPAVMVITCRGLLDVAAMRPCAAALAMALERRPRWVIADLGGAQIVRQSTAVLTLMRRFAARHGTRLALAAVDDEGLRILHEAKVSALYTIRPTVALAIGTAVGTSLQPGEARAPRVAEEPGAAQERVGPS